MGWSKEGQVATAPNDERIGELEAAEMCDAEIRAALCFPIHLHHMHACSPPVSGVLQSGKRQGGDMVVRTRSAGPDPFPEEAWTLVSRLFSGRILLRPDPDFTKAWLSKEGRVSHRCILSHLRLYGIKLLLYISDDLTDAGQWHMCPVHIELLASIRQAPRPRSC